MGKKTNLTHLRQELFSESRLQEFQPHLATLATCQTVHSRYVALRAEHALLYTVKRLIVRWLYSCFYIPVARAPDGANGEAGDFHANLAFFISGQHTKVNHHIYKSQGKPSFIVFTRAWARA